MEEIVELSFFRFLLVYLLLLIVLAVMKKNGASQTKLLVVAGIRMTLQLVLAGFVLTYIFGNPSPIFTTIYLIGMFSFAIYHILSKNKQLNSRFKAAIVLSFIGTGFALVFFFVVVVVNVSLFDPQYTIPLSGMILGNAMTGVTLALKTFAYSVETQNNKIKALLNLGVSPQNILKPFVNNAFETAMLPTLNTMVGMGIIFLPGMMTGQILSGTLPMTAILYQIAIMITICTVVCLASFLALYFGSKTLYNSRNQFV
ncbi:MAG: ABC transporter permease [Methanimicrococcus sp.]|nr:ABC transporter permease [Methanimicrococcus sp.]